MKTLKHSIVILSLVASATSWSSELGEIAPKTDLKVPRERKLVVIPDLEQALASACVAILSNRHDTLVSKEEYVMSTYPDYIEEQYPGLFLTDSQRNYIDRIASRIILDKGMRDLFKEAAKSDLPALEREAIETAIRNQIGKITHHKENTLWTWEYNKGVVTARSTDSKMVIEFTPRLDYVGGGRYAVSFADGSSFSGVQYSTYLKDGKTSRYREISDLAKNSEVLAKFPDKSQAELQFPRFAREERRYFEVRENLLECFYDDRFKARLQSASISDEEHERVQEIVSAHKDKPWFNPVFKCEREGCNQSSR